MKTGSGKIYFTEKDYGGHNHVTTPCIFFDNFISPKECDELVQYCDMKPLRSGSTFKKMDGIRESDIAWLSPEEKPELFNTVMQSIHNSNYWNYDVYGFAEPAQYTVYDSSIHQDAHYGWHTDTGPKNNHRKISMIINLSDPSDYEGGEVKIEYCNNTNPLPHKGSAIIFPSFLHHEVKTVTEGVRKSLVFWIAGPKLR
jgi:PKHD-type hydroxylase